MEGQWFPQQNIQFGQFEVHRSPWRRASLITVLNALGLTTNLYICLDAGDSNSYSTGQTWTDLSGNSTNFYRGATSSASSDDPTFNGTAGGLSPSEYWTFDGGDFFRKTSANTTQINNLHKAGAVWTVLTWFYWTAGDSDGLMGTTQNAGGANGVNVTMSNLAGPVLRVNNGSGNILLASTSAVTGQTSPASTWMFSAFSVNAPAGASGGHLRMNEYSGGFNATYSSPSASNATYVMEVGSRGNGTSGSPIRSGSRLAQFALWSGTALTAAQIESIYQATRSRYDV